MAGSTAGVGSPPVSPRSDEIMDRSTVHVGGETQPSTGKQDTKLYQKWVVTRTLVDRLALPFFSFVSNSFWSTGRYAVDHSKSIASCVGKRTWAIGKPVIKGPGYVFFGLIGIPVISYLLVDRSLKVVKLEKDLALFGWAGVIAASGLGIVHVLPEGIRNTFPVSSENSTTKK